MQSVYKSVDSACKAALGSLCPPRSGSSAKSKLPAVLFKLPAHEEGSSVHRNRAASILRSERLWRDAQLEMMLLPLPPLLSGDT